VVMKWRLMVLLSYIFLNGGKIEHFFCLVDFRVSSAIYSLFFMLWLFFTLGDLFCYYWFIILCLSPWFVCHKNIFLICGLPLRCL
jgi:hypothetical protein